MAHRREIVHRHDRGGAGRRRYDEVGPVHHVDPADEAFDRGVVAAAPECVQRPGRHGPLAGAHPRGEQRIDEPTPSPTHGVGLRLEPGPGGQCAQCALTEGPDPGGLPEQRRRIERDAEPGGLGAPGRVEVAQVLIAPSMERMAPEM